MKFYHSCLKLRISLIEENRMIPSPQSYYVYRYEGSLNGIDHAVVLMGCPKDAHVPKVLRDFVSTDVSLSTREIPDRYVERWPVKVFFR